MIRSIAGPKLHDPGRSAIKWRGQRRLGPSGRRLCRLRHIGKKAMSAVDGRPDSRVEASVLRTSPEVL